MTAMTAVALAAATVVAALSAPAGAPPAPAAGEPSVRLTIAFLRDDGEPRRLSTLRCRGSRASARGWLRGVGAARACRVARRRASLLTTEPDPGRVCTQIYGGPERARISGRIGTREVARSFSRADGCRIADWDRAVPLLPRPRSVQGP